MKRALILFLLLFASNNSAAQQQVQWREVTCPCDSVLPHGIRAAGPRLFALCSVTRDSVELWVSSDGGSQWAKASLPRPVADVGDIYQRADSTFTVMAGQFMTGGIGPKGLLVSDKSGLLWRDTLLPHPDHWRRVRSLFGSREILVDMISIYRWVGDSLILVRENALTIYNAPQQYVAAVSGNVVVMNGERIYEPPQQSENVSVVTTDLGASWTDFDGGNLRAFDSTAIFFQGTGPYVQIPELRTVNPVGATTPTPGRSVLDALVAPSHMFIVSTLDGVFAANPKNPSVWQKLGTMPVEATSLVLYQDTVLFASSSHRIFRADRNVTLDVPPKEPRPMHVAYSPDDHSLWFSSESMDGIQADVYSPVTGIRVSSGMVQNRILDLPRGMAAGVYCCLVHESQRAYHLKFLILEHR